MSYNYNNIIHNPSGGFDEICMKHLIKESCKEVMEEFAIRNSHGLYILQDKVDKLAVQVEILGTIVSSLGSLSPTSADLFTSGSFSNGSKEVDLGFSGAARTILSNFPCLQKKDVNGKAIRITPMDRVIHFIRKQKCLLPMDDDSDECKSSKAKQVKLIKNQLNSFSLIVATELAREVANGHRRLNWGDIDNVVKKKYYTKLEQIASPLNLPLQCCDDQWVAAALLSKTYENNHNVNKVIVISKIYQLFFINFNWKHCLLEWQQL